MSELHQPVRVHNMEDMTKMLAEKADMLTELAVGELATVALLTVGEDRVFWLGVHPPWVGADGKPISRLTDDLTRFSLWGWTTWDPVNAAGEPCLDGEHTRFGDEVLPMPQMIGLLVKLGWLESHWDDEGIVWLVRPTARGIQLLRSA